MEYFFLKYNINILYIIILGNEEMSKFIIIVGKDIDI